MALVPNLDPSPAQPRPWWMTAVVTGQSTNARLPLSHLGQLPRGAIVVSLADYVADTASTADSDPGAGNLRWNHATQADATEIYVSDDDADSNDHGALWAGLSVDGYLYLYKSGDLDTWQEWRIDSVSEESGYLKLGVTLIGSNGSFADDDPVIVTIQQPTPAVVGAAGPDTSTDNALARFNGAAGDALQDSGVLVTDDNEISGYRGNINRQTGTSYTLQASDSGKIVELANVAAITLTLPNSLPRGFCCTVVQDGAGAVTFTPDSGATLKNRQSHTKSAGDGAACMLYVSSNSGADAAYRLGGDTAS